MGNVTIKFNNKELFFDYTWPVNASNLPVSLGSNINSQVTLLELPSTSTISPWGGTNITLPKLGNVTDSTPYNTVYNHTNALADNQAMWCNKFFVGSGNTSPSPDNPYIDYGIYEGQTENYSSKNTSGDDVTGIQVSSTNSLIGTFISNNFNKVKWVLFKQNTVSNSNVTINVKKNSTTNAVLGTDYLLFYCEYKNQLSYGTGGNLTDKYSTWLNAISNSSVSANQIIKIGNANPSGGNNGCSASSSTATTPVIQDLATGIGSNKSKYFLFGLRQGTKISEISIS